MAKYRDALNGEMSRLSTGEKTVFIGQGLLEESAFYGTLSGVRKAQRLEMPCAENLTMGAAVGLALDGWLPVVLFQRSDFLLIAADAILNHAALWPEMSGGQFSLPLIIRVCIGSQNETFDVGLQHKKDFSKLFEGWIDVRYCRTISEIKEVYEQLVTKPTMIVEYKDLYDLEQSD